MPVFLFLNDLAGRWPVLDEIMRFVYVGTVPLLAMVLLARLVLFPQHPKSPTYWRVALGTALAIAAGALLAYGLDYLVQTLNLGTLSSRPFMTRRVNLLIVEPQDNSFPSLEVALAAIFAVSCWVAERKTGYFAFALAVLLAGARLFCGTNYFADVAVGFAFGVALALLGLAVAGAKWPRLALGIQAATGAVGLGALLLGVYLTFAANPRFAAKLALHTSPQQEQSKAPETILQGGEGKPAEDDSSSQAPVLTNSASDARAYQLSKRATHYLPHVEKYLLGQLMLRAQPFRVLDVEVAPVNFEESSYRSGVVRFQIDPQMPNARQRVAEVAARLVKAAFALDSQLQNVDVIGVVVTDSLEAAQELDDSQLIFVGNEVPVFTASVQRKNLVLKEPKWANLPNLDGGSWLRTRSRLYINEKALPIPPAAKNEPVPTPAPQH